MAFFNTDGMGNSMFGGIGQFGSNMFSSWFNNFLAEQRENRAREANYKYNEMAAKEADKRQRAQYNDLYSPKAQMQQLQEAGLSPSIYASGGMAGKSGAGAIMGGGASGVGPSMYAAQPVSALEAAQIGKLNAETKNIEANTNNQNKTSKLIDAQIIDTYASAGLKSAQEALTKVDTSLQQVALNIASATEAVQIQGVMDTMTTAFYESVIAQHEAERRGLLYKKETALFETEIATKIAEYENLLMDLSVKSAGIELTQAQAHSLLQHVAIDWYNAGTNRMNAHTQYENLQAQVKQWAEQNNINLKELDRKKTEMWIDGACRIVGTLGNVACAALGAKSISTNNSKTEITETSTWDPKNGTRTTTTRKYKK